MFIKTKSINMRVSFGIGMTYIFLSLEKKGRIVCGTLVLHSSSLHCEAALNCFSCKVPIHYFPKTVLDFACTACSILLPCFPLVALASLLALFGVNLRVNFRFLPSSLIFSHLADAPFSDNFRRKLEGVKVADGWQKER